MINVSLCLKSFLVGNLLMIFVEIHTGYVLSSNELKKQHDVMIFFFLCFVSDFYLGMKIHYNNNNNRISSYSAVNIHKVVLMIFFHAKNHK